MAEQIATVEPDGTIIIRCSSLSIAADCFRRNAARSWPTMIESYGYKLRRTGTHVGAAVGRTVHGAAETVLRRRINGQQAMSREELGDVTGQGLEVELSSDEINYDEVTRGSADAMLQACRMVNTYVAQVAPRFTPDEVETRLEAVYRPGFVLSGQKDVLALGDGGLRDLKTGRKRSQNSAQLGGYLLLAKANEKWRDITRLVEDFLGRSRKPVDAVEIDYSPKDAMKAALAILDVLTRQVTAFQADPSNPWAFPANPRSMLCSDRHCPAWGTNFCREGRPS